MIDLKAREEGRDDCREVGAESTGKQTGVADAAREVASSAECREPASCLTSGVEDFKVAAVRRCRCRRRADRGGDREPAKTREAKAAAFHAAERRDKRTGRRSGTRARCACGGFGKRGVARRGPEPPFG